MICLFPRFEVGDQRPPVSNFRTHSGPISQNVCCPAPRPYRPGRHAPRSAHRWRTSRSRCSVWGRWTVCGHGCRRSPWGWPSWWRLIGGRGREGGRNQVSITSNFQSFLLSLLFLTKWFSVSLLMWLDQRKEKKPNRQHVLHWEPAIIQGQVPASRTVKRPAIVWRPLLARIKQHSRNSRKIKQVGWGTNQSH